MRSLSGAKEPEAAADAIIHQPSVRTMLLTQKAIAEGGRSMVYECAKVADHMQDAEAAGDASAAKEYDERLAFLTPILKGFLTEMGKEAADLGIQVYGGHGYIKDNKAEQVHGRRMRRERTATAAAETRVRSSCCPTQPSRRRCAGGVRARAPQPSCPSDDGGQHAARP